MPDLVINRGIPASGKTTYSKEWVTQETKRVRVNRDDLREHLFNQGFGYDEEMITLVEHSTIRTALRAGYSVIVDATHIERKYVNKLAYMGYELGANVILKEFVVPLERALQWNDTRKMTKGYVPEDVIVAKYRRMQKIGSVTLPPKPSVELYEPIWDKPRAIIVDVDGTIAHRDPNGRGPFEWDRVDEDTAIPNVITVVRNEYAQGTDVLIVSGRDGSCYDKTRHWLINNRVPFNRLLMRPQNDMRRDSIVKRELFDKYIRHQYNVQYVLDDRQQVVDMWRALGLTCLQVDYGEF